MSGEDILYLAICALTVVGGFIGVTVFVSKTWGVWKDSIILVILFLLMCLASVVLLFIIITGAFIVYDSGFPGLANTNSDLVFAACAVELLLIAMNFLVWRMAQRRQRFVATGLFSAKILWSAVRVSGGTLLTFIGGSMTNSSLVWLQWLGWALSAAGLLIALSAVFWKDTLKARGQKSGRRQT